MEAGLPLARAILFLGVMPDCRMLRRFNDDCHDAGWIEVFSLN
jgi:hypothetical protein